MLGCFDVLALLSVGITAAYFPNLSAISARLAGGNQARSQQFEQYGHLCVKPGLDYFVTKFKNGPRCQCSRLARLFVPHKVTEMQPDANTIDGLAVFPFLNDPTILSQLKGELPEYLVKAEDLSADMAPLEWQEHNLPTWFASIFLIQPSSSAAESFLLVKRFI